MTTRRSLLAGAIGAGGLALWRPGHARIDSETLVIADQRGDHGLLAPYAHAINGFGYVFTSYLFDSLVGQDAQGTGVPALATAWRASVDAMTWELELDPKARWHDGKPVTAEDAVFTLDYLRRHPYAFAPVDGIASTRASGSTRLRIDLVRPDAGFVRNVLMTVPILPRHIYASRSLPRQFVMPEAATGSGPYRLAKYDRAQGRYMLERNANYYLGAPKFARIAIVRMGPETAIEGIRRGEVDVLTDLPFELVARAKSAGLRVLTTASRHVERLVFNHKGLFAERSARQGLAHAIDRHALVDTVHPGAAKVAEIGYFQPGSPWFSPLPAQSYPPDRFRADGLLHAAGWQRGSQGRWHDAGQAVNLRLVADARARKPLVVLAEQLDAFGCGVDLRILEPASLQQTVSANEFDLLLRSTSTIGDPSGIASRVLGSAWTSDRYPDPDGRMRAVLDAQASAARGEDRQRFLAKFSALYAETLPSLMLSDPLWAVAHGPRITPRFLPDGIASGIPIAVPKCLLTA